jgi:peptide/nickel transport system ATP-binding protein
MTANQPTLVVENLRTHFFTRAGVVKAVDDVSFAVQRGRVLGLVGESGSGKSVTGFSIIGLVDPPGRIVGGRVLFNGEDLVSADEKRLRHLRGDRVAMIFQDPMMTLNPVLRIDTQMVETIRAHDPAWARRASGRATRWGASAFPRPTSGSRPIRINSPAECANAWRLRSRC